MGFQKGHTIRNKIKGRGRGYAFLESMLREAPADCVVWPMFRDVNGYARVGYNGELLWAHTLMCQMKNGPRPTEDHEATHSCGNGKGGCVNPRHLAWGTRTQNQLDRTKHGTRNTAWWGRNGKLKAEEVVAIRALAGKKTQAEIAAIFGITDATVRDILSGKTWRNVVVTRTVA